MSQSGLRPGSSCEDDGQPILRTLQDGQTDSMDWITGLRDYVNSMKERCPGEYHPDEEWLSKGFAMISLDWERTVTTAPKQGTSGVSGQVSGGHWLLCKETWMSRLLVLLTLSSALSRSINLR